MKDRRTVLREMLPGVPAGLDFTQVQMRGGFSLRRDVLIMPADEFRAGADGIEVRSDDGAWHPAPAGMRIVAEGAQLDYSHLDYVVGIYGLRIEKRSILAADGAPEAVPLAQPVGELARVPADKYMQAFEAAKVQR